MARCSSIAHPHEADLSRLLMCWLAVGFVSMLGPGVLVGLVGALGIDPSPFPAFGTPEWIRQHSHAQMFGWMATFIWGISLFAVPRLRNVPLQRKSAWLAWILWTSGLAIFFGTPVEVIPRAEIAGLALQCVASLVLAFELVPPAPRSFRGSHPSVVIIATGLWMLVFAIAIELTSAVIDAGASFRTSSLLLTVWGALATVTWGYATRWLPAVINLRKPRVRFYPVIAAFQVVAVGLFLARAHVAGAVVVAVSAGMFLFAIRIFEPGAGAPRIRGVHAGFPYFVRLAHVWMVLSIVLSARAFSSDASVWSSTPRHLFTVGFLASMILAIGPRMLPSFIGRIRLFSTTMMGASMMAMALGCSIRAINYLVMPDAPQSWFVFFAPLEVTGMLLFVANAIGTVIAVPTMEEHVANLAAEREAA